MAFVLRCLFGHRWDRWAAYKHTGGWEYAFRYCRRCGCKETRWTPPARFFR